MKLCNNYIPIERKKILITGGLGFIGSSLARELLKYNNDILLWDICSKEGSSSEEMGLLSSENISVLQGSILDDQVIHSLPLDFDYIIHTAGILGIKKVAEKPLLTADVNVFGTRKVLDLASRQQRLKRFILFSTSEIYGPHSSNVNENAPGIIPNEGMRWVYASSKHFTEYLLKAFIKEYGLPGVIVRPFNVYGPFRKGGNAMTALVQKALGDEQIEISGHGQQTRAWCYIDDFLQGLIQCMLVENIIGEAFNLGNNAESITMFSLAEMICTLLNSKSNIKILGFGDEDVLDRSPDITKAKNLLGYKPQVFLEQGIKQLAEYHTNQLALRI